MLRACSRVSRMVTTCLAVSLLAASAEATEILVDDFGAPPPTDYSAFLSITTGAMADFISNGTGTFTFVTSATTTPFVTLLYGGAPNPSFSVDLTGGGINDTLVIDVVSVVPSVGPALITLGVTAVDGMTTATLPAPLVVTGGPIQIAFTDFSDSSVFNSLDSLEFTFASTGPFALQMNEIKAIPEPATALMLGLGLLGLAVAGRPARQDA